jgi:hypothetical protein
MKALRLVLGAPGDILDSRHAEGHELCTNSRAQVDERTFLGRAREGPAHDKPELLSDIHAHLEAAGANARSDGCDEPSCILRLAARAPFEKQPHGLFDDARDHTAPPRVNRGDVAGSLVTHEHRNAVGHPHAYCKWPVRNPPDQRIPVTSRRLRCKHRLRPMNLLDLHDDARPHRFEQGGVRSITGGECVSKSRSLERG